MKTVVVTDVKYRASIAAVRVLGRAGYRVVAVQSRGDARGTPPVFASRYVSEHWWLPGSASDGDYADRLYSLLESRDRPVLLCVGAQSLHTVSWQRERFREVCDFLIPPPAVLDGLNDKSAVHRRCTELRIPVPAQFEGSPPRYPVVVKPRCGERFGLKAGERYRIAENELQWRQAVRNFAPWDPDPLVQERLEGVGLGASVLMGRKGELLAALCHRRIREYPVTGGPSACCESIYDPELVRTAHRLLRSFRFQGFAMVEFKGGRVLEVNPRIWGSFPLTEQAGSPMAVLYARAAAGERIEYAPQDYQSGVRMRFLLNDSAAMLSLLRRGEFRRFGAGLPDCLRAKEALYSRDDPDPFFHYLSETLLRR